MSDELFLAPTADIPESSRKGPNTPPVYAPCACGTMVLTGVLWHTTTRITVEAGEGGQAYQVVWESGAALPTLRPGGDWAVHGCPGVATQGEKTLA